MRNILRGTGVALVTPFDQDKRIDFPALGRLIEHVIAGGVNYLVALGTTAETPTLTCGEKEELVSYIKKQNNGRLPLVVGIGGNDTAEVIRQIHGFDPEGVSAVLSVTPYYNKPSQEGLYQHYKAIAQASPKPVILYNVPGRTGVNMTPETTLRLARDFENIVATKEASCSISQMSYILRDKPERFMVISGDDNMALPLAALGGDGVISVAANAFPDKMSQMIRLCLENDFAKASKIQLDLLECVEALFAEGNPVGVKAALALKGIVRNELRLPLVPCSGGLCERIENLVKTYNL